MMWASISGSNALKISGMACTSSNAIKRFRCTAKKPLHPATSRDQRHAPCLKKSNPDGAPQSLLPRWSCQSDKDRVAPRLGNSSADQARSPVSSKPSWVNCQFLKPGSGSVYRTKYKVKVLLKRWLMHRVLMNRGFMHRIFSELSVSAPHAPAASVWPRARCARQRRHRPAPPSRPAYRPGLPASPG